MEWRDRRENEPSRDSFHAHFFLRAGGSISEFSLQRFRFLRGSRPVQDFGCCFLKLRSQILPQKISSEHASELGSVRVMQESFESFGLAPWLVQACQQMGIRKPTPIQRRSIPKILKAEGSGLVARAKTGSGKTAAFALPILHELSKDPFGVFGLVLTPTRELAFQIMEQIHALGQPINVQAQVVVGGRDMMLQALELSKNPHIIVATPGRLADHLSSATEIRFTDLQYLVLDEADRLMEPSFEEDLAVIYKHLPPVDERMTLLFSATLTEDTASEYWEKLNIPGSLVYVECNDEFGESDSEDEEDEELDSLSRKRKSRGSDGDGSENEDETEESGGETGGEMEKERRELRRKKKKRRVGGLVVRTLDQRYIFLPQAVKECYLAFLVTESEWAGEPTIIFTATCRGAELITAFLEEMGVDCVSLHSRLSQDRRLASLGKFRGGFSKILVATDVAGRGLDIPTVKLVVNYDVPRKCEDYVHRVGRTARAGQGGLAISFVSQYDVKIFKAIEEFMELTMENCELEEKEVLKLLKKSAEAKRMARLKIEQYANTQPASSYHRQKLKRIRQKRMLRV